MGLHVLGCRVDIRSHMFRSLLIIRGHLAREFAPISCGDEHGGNILLVPLTNTGNYANRN